MSPVPEYSRLFELRDPSRSKPFVLDQAGPSKFSDRELAELWRGDLAPSSPVSLRAFMGREAADVLWSGWVSIVVVSERVRDLLRDCGFTGWSTYQVEVHNRRGDLLAGFHGLAVTGRAGNDDYRRSSTASKPAWSGGNPRDVLVGEYFIDDRWDGMDFSVMGQGGHAIVTRRVVDVFESARIGNVRFIRLTESEMDVSSLRILGSWPLSSPASGEGGS